MGAHDINGRRASFTNYGDQVKITAPGVNVAVRTREGGTAFFNGTSFSSPLTAGAAAVLISDRLPVKLTTLITSRATVQFQNGPVRMLAYKCDPILW